MDPNKKGNIEAGKLAIDMVIAGNQNVVAIELFYPELDTYAASHGLVMLRMPPKDTIYSAPKKVSDVITFEVLTKVKESYTATDAVIFQRLFEEIRMLPLAEGLYKMAHRVPDTNPRTEFLVMQMLDALMFGADGIDPAQIYGVTK